MTRNLFVLFVVALTSSTAVAADHGERTYFVRAKAGYGVPTGLSNSDSVAAGLDLGASCGTLDYFLTGMVLPESADRRFIPFGVAAAYRATGGSAEPYFGLVTGALSLHDKTNTMNAALVPTTIDNSRTRFMVGALSGIDVKVVSSFYANASLQYSKAFGPEAELGIVTATLGLAYRF